MTGVRPMINRRYNLAALCPIFIWTLILICKWGILFIDEPHLKGGIPALLAGLFLEGFFQGLPFFITTTMAYRLIKKGATGNQLAINLAIMLVPITLTTVYMYYIDTKALLGDHYKSTGAIALGFLMFANLFLVFVGILVGKLFIRIEGNAKETV